MLRITRQAHPITEFFHILMGFEFFHIIYMQIVANTNHIGISNSRKDRRSPCVEDVKRTKKYPDSRNGCSESGQPYTDDESKLFSNVSRGT